MRIVVSLIAILPAIALTAWSARSPDYTPQTAVAKMRPAEGFTIRLVASEPLLRRPVALEFDDRGLLCNDRLAGGYLQSLMWWRIIMSWLSFVDGRVLTGLMAAQTPGTITLLDS